MSPLFNLHGDLKNLLSVKLWLLSLSPLLLSLACGVEHPKKRDQKFQVSFEKLVQGEQF